MMKSYEKNMNRQKSQKKMNYKKNKHEIKLVNTDTQNTTFSAASCSN